MDGRRKMRLAPVLCEAGAKVRYWGAAVLCAIAALGPAAAGQVNLHFYSMPGQEVDVTIDEGPAQHMLDGYRYEFEMAPGMHRVQLTAKSGLTATAMFDLDPDAMAERHGWKWWCVGSHRSDDGTRIDLVLLSRESCARMIAITINPDEEPQQPPQK
jgi:hypothetical protein